MVSCCTSPGRGANSKSGLTRSSRVCGISRSAKGEAAWTIAFWKAASAGPNTSAPPCRVSCESVLCTRRDARERTELRKERPNRDMRRGEEDIHNRNSTSDVYKHEASWRDQNSADLSIMSSAGKHEWPMPVRAHSPSYPKTCTLDHVKIASARDVCGKAC